MHDAYIFISFMLIHIGLGRKISIPYYLALGQDVLIVILIAILLDLLQIPVLEYLFSHAKTLARPIIDRFLGKIETREDSRLVKWGKKVGPVGTIVIVAMPIQGGGMWSGVLLSHILELKRNEKYILLTIGSIIGCSIIGFGINQLIEFL